MLKKKQMSLNFSKALIIFDVSSSIFSADPGVMLCYKMSEETKKIIVNFDVPGITYIFFKIEIKNG